MTNKCFTGVDKKSLVLISIILLMSATSSHAVTLCKDENGKPYFTDIACPKGTTKQNNLKLKESNTYRARDSINIDLVNDYERRYNTGRSWRWVKKQRRTNK